MEFTVNLSNLLPNVHRRYVDCVDACGFTALHYAVLHDRRTAMRVLFGFDANLIPRCVRTRGEGASSRAGVCCLCDCCYCSFGAKRSPRHQVRLDRGNWHCTEER